MPLRLHVAIGASLVAMIGSVTYAFMYPPKRGELFDKRGWSVLQGLNDPVSSSGTVLVRRGEFAAVGFRGIGKPTVAIHGAESHWSWVLLNEHHADGEVKQLPEFGSYDLPCSELPNIRRTVRDADAYVMEHLQAICS
jgi:hypothetical protein